MIKVQNRRDLDPAVMAIPMFTGQELEKCLDWINRIKRIFVARQDAPRTKN